MIDIIVVENGNKVESYSVSKEQLDMVESVLKSSQLSDLVDQIWSSKGLPCSETKSTKKRQEKRHIDLKKRVKSIIINCPTSLEDKTILLKTLLSQEHLLGKKDFATNWTKPLLEVVSPVIGNNTTFQKVASQLFDILYHSKSGKGEILLLLLCKDVHLLGSKDQGGDILIDSSKYGLEIKDITGGASFNPYTKDLKGELGLIHKLLTHHFKDIDECKEFLVQIYDDPEEDDFIQLAEDLYKTNNDKEKRERAVGCFVFKRHKRKKLFDSGLILSELDGNIELTNIVDEEEFFTNPRKYRVSLEIKERTSKSGNTQAVKNGYLDLKRIQ